jgi:hypothetical protein
MQVLTENFTYETGIESLKNLLLGTREGNFEFGRVVDEMFALDTGENISYRKISVDLKGELKEKDISRKRNYYCCCRVLHHELGRVVFPVFTFTRDLKAEPDMVIFSRFIIKKRISNVERLSVQVCLSKLILFQ